MKKVVAHNYIYEDKLDQAIQVFNELIKETIKENGCITYELFIDENDKTHFIFIEEWETIDNLNKHIKSTHFKKAIIQISQIAKRQADVYILDKMF